MTQVGDSTILPSAGRNDDATGHVDSQQSEAAGGTRRSSRHGINGSFDLILAHRLQQEEYWSMHKKQPKAKKTSNAIASSSEPIKRAFDTSSPVATSAQLLPHSSAAATSPHKKAHLSAPSGQRSIISRPSGDACSDQVSSNGSASEIDLIHNKEMDRVALLLLALQECCDEVPPPQIVEKEEIVINVSGGSRGSNLSFRLSPIDSQCQFANDISLHPFKAPIALSIAHLCSIITEKLGPCAAASEVQFFVRGLLLSKFATLQDAHALWTVVFCGMPMTIHFRVVCACASSTRDHILGT